MLNGRKWYTSGVLDPDCKLIIFMGKSNPDAPTYRQQSMILVPRDTPGITVLRDLPMFGYTDRLGHGEVQFTDVRVPVENMLGEEGRRTSRSPRAGWARAGCTTPCGRSAWPNAPST